MQEIRVALPASKKKSQIVAASSGLSVLPPLSLYIHWPWCIKKCPYCDFNSHEPTAELDLALQMQYVNAVLLDLEDTLPAVWGRQIISIFIGGGTPSLMLPSVLDALLSGVRARLPLLADAEITLETNPGSLREGFDARGRSEQRLLAFAASGVNRISIGVQSFNATHLQALGRIHNPDQAHAAIAQAQASKARVNIDLMYGLPQQSLAQAEEDMRSAIATGVSHISAYHLTLEPNTFFHRFPPTLPDDEVCADMQASLHGTLLDAGFLHYETSAYAQAEKSCQHNLNYWQYGDYIGIGAGAHGKISSPWGIVRTVKHKHPKTYMACASQAKFVGYIAAQDNFSMLQSNRFAQDTQSIADSARTFEFMLNAMRLTGGFAAQTYAERTGLAQMHIAAQRDALLSKGLIELRYEEGVGEWISPTPLGQRFLNDVVETFL